MARRKAGSIKYRWLMVSGMILGLSHCRANMPNRFTSSGTEKPADSKTGDAQSPNNPPPPTPAPTQPKVVDASPKPEEPPPAPDEAKIALDSIIKSMCTDDYRPAVVSGSFTLTNSMRAFETSGTNPCDASRNLAALIASEAKVTEVLKSEWDRRITIDAKTKKVL